MKTKDITDAISRFCIDTNSESIPITAYNVARLSLLDWLSVSVAGRGEPVSKIVRELIIEENGSGNSSVFGLTKKYPPRAAALSNGTTSHALDYDDTHFINIGHPSVAVLPAATAIAQHRGASQQEWHCACLIGMEVACRVGHWLGREHYQRGYHQTATAGSIGATAAVSRLLKLNIEQTRYALGLVATRASGLKSQFGTMAKPYHAGIAAANGVEASMLALGGFVSNPVALECDQGFASTHYGQSNSDAFDEMGTDYVFESVQHKFHACCHGTHAMLEALQALTKKHQIDAVDVESIVIKVHSRWLLVCDIKAPSTGLEAKFSYRMTASMCLHNLNTAAIDNFTDELCKDQRLIETCDKVTVRSDDTLAETAALVEIQCTDGRRIEAHHDLADQLVFENRKKRVLQKSATLLGDDAMEDLWSILSDDNSDLSVLFHEVQLISTTTS